MLSVNFFPQENLSTGPIGAPYFVCRWLWQSLVSRSYLPQPHQPPFPSTSTDWKIWGREVSTPHCPLCGPHPRVCKPSPQAPRVAVWSAATSWWSLSSVPCDFCSIWLCWPSAPSRSFLLAHSHFLGLTHFFLNTVACRVCFLGCPVQSVILPLEANGIRN